MSMDKIILECYCYNCGFVYNDGKKPSKRKYKQKYCPSCFFDNQGQIPFSTRKYINKEHTFKSNWWSRTKRWTTKEYIAGYHMPYTPQTLPDINIQNVELSNLYSQFRTLYNKIKASDERNCKLFVAKYGVSIDDMAIQLKTRTDKKIASALYNVAKVAKQTLDQKSSKYRDDAVLDALLMRTNDENN